MADTATEEFKGLTSDAFDADKILGRDAMTDENSFVGSDGQRHFFTPQVMAKLAARDRENQVGGTRQLTGHAVVDSFLEAQAKLAEVERLNAEAEAMKLASSRAGRAGTAEELAATRASVLADIETAVEAYSILSDEQTHHVWDPHAAELRVRDLKRAYQAGRAAELKAFAHVRDLVNAAVKAGAISPADDPRLREDFPPLAGTIETYRNVRVLPSKSGEATS